MQLDIVVSPPANPHRRATRVFGVAYESHPVGGFDAKSLLSIYTQNKRRVEVTPEVELFQYI